MLIVGCASPPAPDPSVPDQVVSAKPISGPRLTYPLQMQQAGREGEADVSCLVMADGSTKDCVVTQSLGGSAFADAALDYTAHSRYQPATRNGVPFETRHRWTITFKLSDTPGRPVAPSPPLAQQAVIQWAPPSKIPVSATPLVYPKQLQTKKISGSADVECRVLATGRTADCRVTQASNPAFAAPALDYVSGAVYAPAIRNGVPVETRYQWTISFKPT